MRLQNPPHHLLEVAVEPALKINRAPLIKALQQISDEDPSLALSIHENSGQIIIKGTSEQHLDTTIDLLRREQNVDVRVGMFRVAYQEVATAMAPLANMLGYSDDFKLISNGEASHTMAFAHAETVADPSAGPVTGKAECPAIDLI